MFFMKVLILTPYLFISGLEGFEKSSSGFGYIIGQIAKGIAKSETVSVLTQFNFTKETYYDNIHFFRRNKLYTLRCFSLFYLSKWIKDTKHLSLFSHDKIRAFYCYMSGKYAERIIRKEKPEIVNICGVSFATESFIYACKRTGIKYLVTLHGLNSFNKEIEMCYDEAVLESKLIQDVKNQRITISVVSSGIKKRIEETENGKVLRNIHVITNGIEIPNDREDGKKYELFRNKLNIHKEAKVIICCSGLNRNKNQIQILRAYCMLPENIKNRIIVLLVGSGEKEAEINEYVIEHRLEENVRLVGRVNKNEINNYYAISDINILVSHSEGFGNSIVEGFSYGLPAIMFSDMDAVEDLYDSRAMIKVNERTDEKLAEAIVTAISSEWDKKYIIEHAKKYSEDNMIRKYTKLYKQLIRQ